MAKMFILLCLVLVVAEGFVDRGDGAPCAVHGRYGPGVAFAAAVLFVVMWIVAIPL